MCCVVSQGVRIMLIFPAIDLRRGKCVRLVQGCADAETVYDDDPVKTALSWKNAGAQWLHLVDLDGAFAGEPRQLPVVREIIKESRASGSAGRRHQDTGTDQRSLYCRCAEGDPGDRGYH